MGSFRRGIRMCRSQDIKIESRPSPVGKSFPASNYVFNYWFLISYGHILIVVVFLVVNFFSFLVIAPSHQLQSGQK